MAPSGQQTSVAQNTNAVLRGGGLLEHTGNLDPVRKALGHTNISTTLIYTHMTDRHLTEKVNETFGGEIAQRKRKRSAKCTCRSTGFGAATRRYWSTDSRWR